MKLFSSKLFSARKKRKLTPELEAAYAMWNSAGESLAMAERAFAEATEDGLIDAAIYEIKAAEAKMSYALRLIRDMGPEIIMEPVPEMPPLRSLRERAEVRV